MSRPSFYVVTRLFVFSSILCRDPVLLCRDNTSLPCVGIFVAIWKSLLRPCLSMFSLFLCRDIKTSLQLEVCHNIELFCYNQVSSLSQHHLSRLCFSIRTINLILQCRDIHYLVATELLHTVSRHRLPCRERGISSAYSFCLNRLFQVAIISVVTLKDYVAT